MLANATMGDDERELRRLIAQAMEPFVYECRALQDSHSAATVDKLHRPCPFSIVSRTRQVCRASSMLRSTVAV
jgi:hypothetical protein